jgi:hypothetical protein
LRRRIQDLDTVAHLNTLPRVAGLFSFVDNPAARLAAGMVARKLFVPHVDVGSLIQFNERGDREISGDIRLFEPGVASGCVACTPPLADLDAALYAVRSPSGSMVRGARREWNSDRDGSLLWVNSLVASLAVQLWLRYLSGHANSHWVRIYSVADAPPTISEHPVAGAEACPICSMRHRN